MKVYLFCLLFILASLYARQSKAQGSTQIPNNESYDKIFDNPETYVKVHDVEDSITYLNEFVNPEVPAQFPGGEDSLLSFITNNLRYPNYQGTIEGIVYVDFTVDTIGNISNAKVVRSLHPEFDKEALRVINLMPKWIPARVEDRKISMRFTMPVKFPSI